MIARIFLVLITVTLFGCSPSYEKIDATQSIERIRTPLNLTNNGSANDNFEWSPDGESIIYSCLLEWSGYRICSISVDGENASEILTPATRALDRFPQYAPDGKKFAFTCIEASADRSLCLTDLSKPTEFQVISGESYGLRPKWSPNGEWIAYKCDDDYSQNALCVMNAKDTNANSKVLTPPLAGQVFGFDWSPNSKKIAYDCNNSNKISICIVELDKPIKRTQFGNSDINVHPQWSPDGTKIAYDCHLGKICIAEIGRFISIKELSVGAVASSEPQWSPDGKKIAYGCMSGVLDICVIHVDEPQTIVRLTNDDRENTKPLWSPDGKKIAYQCDDRAIMDICIIEVE